MVKLIAAFIIGLGLGAGVVVLVTNLTGEPESISPASPIIETSPNATTPTRPQAPSSQAKSLADIQSLPSEFERNAALYTRLQSTDVGTLDILLDEAGELSDPGRVKQVIYSRYVQLDPRAALDRLGDEERDPQTLIRTTVSEVARVDLDRALAFLDTLDKPLHSARGILGLDSLSDARKEEVAKRFALEPYLWQLHASSQAKSDPAGAWRAALAIQMRDEQNAALSSVAHTWFETDPSAALSAAASLGAGDWRAWQSDLVHRWVDQDPDAALEWALAQPGSGQHPDPLTQVAARIASHSPQEMLELVEALEPPRRNGVVEGVFLAWGQSDPEAALDTAMAMTNAAHLYQTVGFSIVGFWANEDPQAAFEWVRAQGPSPTRSSLLASTLANIGWSDPERALTLADELDGIARSRAIASVLGIWGEEDPLAAAAWLDASGDQTPAAVQAVASHYAEVDPEGALEWLQDQSAEAQHHAMPMVVRRVAAESPDSALRLIDRIGDSNAKQAAGFQLIATWIETDPQTAVRAIARMDDSESEHLYLFAFQMWSRFDHKSATAFLDQIPSSNRDGAIQGMVQQAAFRDPDLAERFFDRLKGDEARRSAASMLFHSFREVDPKRAERYRELSGVTDEQRVNSINIYR